MENDSPDRMSVARLVAELADMTDAQWSAKPGQLKAMDLRRRAIEAELIGRDERLRGVIARARRASLDVTRMLGEG